MAEAVFLVYMSYYIPPLEAAAVEVPGWLHLVQFLLPLLFKGNLGFVLYTCLFILDHHTYDGYVVIGTICVFQWVVLV